MTKLALQETGFGQTKPKHEYNWNKIDFQKKKGNFVDLLIDIKLG